MTPLDHALRYAERGWRVIPVRPGHKYPKGFDEWQVDATTDPGQINRWWSDAPDYGVSIVTGDASGIFVVDVDPRHGGDETLADLEHEHGRLPDTVEGLTGGGGRHIYFAMPEGATITNDAGKRLGPGLDVRGEGGQVVAPPTIHPETGARYEWEALSDPLDGVPVVEAPAWLVELLTADLAPPTPRRPTKPRLSTGDRPGDRFEAENEWADLLTADGWQIHSGRSGRAGDYELWTGPHKTPKEGASASLYYGGSDVLKVFTSSIPQLEQDATYTRFGYYAAMHHGGDHAAAARALKPTPPANVDPSTGEISSEPSWTNLPDAFWDARPELAQIRQAAHSRLVSADSVLLATLARIVMLTPPQITLPAIVGSRVSLNLFVSVIDASGGGKSAAVAVARELLPHDRKDVADPILPSSGEGLIEAFMGMVEVEGDDGKKRKERQQVNTAGLAWVDEGQGLLAQGERSGSTIMETIRSAWMGGDLGQHNATEERRRWLKSHRYRLSMIVGFQLTYAASLIADGEGGTPQRFTFASANDPSIDPEVAWPGEIDWEAPPTTPYGADMEFDPCLAAGIRQRRLERSRGTLVVDPLDTHADLRKMKLAAALALLDERMNVSVADWELAEMIDRTSCSVRTLAVEYDRANRAREVEAHNRRLADRDAQLESEASRRALDSGARSLARKVHKIGGEVRYSVIRDSVAGKHRDVVSVEDMIAHAIELRWLRQVDVEPINGHDDGRRWVPGEAKPL